MKHRVSTRTDDGNGADSKILFFILARHEKDLRLYESVHLYVHVPNEGFKNMNLCIAGEL